VVRGAVNQLARPVSMDVPRWSPEAAKARRNGTPVVALESSVLAQGLPVPANAEAAQRMCAAVTATGAVPAITAVVNGLPSVGLTTDELERFLARDGIEKASARDLAVAMIRGVDAATTVAAAIAICHAAQVSVFSTGGIGGVHRESAFDESADLIELSRRPVVVVCAGPKSLLDLPATMERLETYGVTLLGFRTAELPGFFYSRTGIPLPHVVHEAASIAEVFISQRMVGASGALLVVQEPPASHALPRQEVEQALDQAREAARSEDVRGPAVTPFLLAALTELTGGRTLAANIALLEANARLAGEIAVALAERTRS
jgi:pseudouridine-5'-phosphate glycosidase